MLDFSEIERALAKKMFGTDARLRTWQAISVMLKNKIGIDQVLEELYNRASDNGRKPKETNAIAYQEWRQAILNGARFSDAIAGWVPDMERLLIMAGEQSGTLPKAFDSVIAVTQASRQINGVIRSGLTYPAVLVAATIGYLFLFGMKIVPSFAMIMDPSQWGPGARSLYLLSEFTIHYGVYSIAALLLFIAIIVLTLPVWTGSARNAVDKLPPWSLYRLVVGAGFMQALAALLNGGGRIKDALQAIAVISSPYLRERVEGFLLGLNSGLNAGDAMRDSGYDFPSKEIVADLGIYAKHSGDFGQALDTIAQEWMETGVKRIEQQMGIIKGLAIMLIALTLVWILGGFFAIQMEISTLARRSG